MRHIFIRPIFLIRAEKHARGESDLAYRVEANNVYDCLPIVSRLKAYGYANATFRRVGEERYTKNLIARAVR